jgi:hypothetical protein
VDLVAQGGQAVEDLGKAAREAGSALSSRVPSASSSCMSATVW